MFILGFILGIITGGTIAIIGIGANKWDGRIRKHKRII